MEKNKLEKMRDILREIVDIIDEILAFEVKEDSGEDVQKESEALFGRFMFKMIELQTLQQ